MSPPRLERNDASLRDAPTTRVPYVRVTAQPLDDDATEHMVAMRDGIRLATDVYLCEGAEPGPTVLIRNPYDKSGEYTFLPRCAAYMVKRGYHVVVQDVRGKFRSEGATVLFVNEALDGYDTIEWLISQTWSNGIVGMWGDSYYGYTPLAAASTGHPALRAIVPRVTGSRIGALPVKEPGRRTIEVEMGVHRLYPTTHFQSNDTFSWAMDWTRRPFADFVEHWFATVGERSPTYDMWMPDAFELDRFPCGHPFDAEPVPILQTIGYWDNCAHWQWEDHQTIAARPRWAAVEYLQLEDIDHENYQFIGRPATPDNDHALAPGALTAMMPRYLDPALDFFDVFLRGRGSPADIPRVRYAIAGEPTQRVAECWPPPDTVTTSWYPTADRRLSTESPPTAITTTWIHDPDDCVPSPVTNAFAFLAEYPDERALADRSDVLAFDGAPFTAPLVLAGPVELAATISSSGPEMDLFARLTDVKPDGAAHLVASGQITLLDASRPEHVTVAMGHTGYRIDAGHHLRLTIASSDLPEFVPTPGNGEHRWLATDTTPNEQHITIGGPHPAVLHITTLFPPLTLTSAQQS